MINGQARQNSIGQGAGINAQPNSNQFGSGLYRSADIRRSLNLTDAQIDRLNAANTQIQQRYQNQLSQVSNLTPEQRTAALESLQARQVNDFYQSANGVFTPQQLQRYRQLEYQYRGPAALTSAEIRGQLNLTDSQLRALQVMQQNALAPQAFLQNSDGSIRNNGLQEYNAYRQHTSEQMDAILSQEQRDRWRGLIGEPYNFGPYVSSVFVR